MIKFPVILCLLFFSASNIYAQALNKVRWLSFEEAIRENIRAPKKVYIDLYTDWCGWCKKMDKTTFSDLEVVNYLNSKYYCVKFNAEMKDTVRFGEQVFVYRADNRTHELAIALMQNNLSGYPASVFLNEQNEILTSFSGFMNKESFMPVTRYFGENKHLTMSWEEYQKSLGAK